MFSPRHIEVEEVGPGAWASIARTDGHAVGNAGFVDVGDEVLVFDTHLAPQAAAELRHEAESRAAKPIAWIAVSHWHADHVVGTAAFPQVEVVGTERTRELMSSVGRERLAEYRRGWPEERAELEARLASEPDRREATELEIAATEAALAVEPRLPTQTFDELRDFGRAELLTYGGGHTESDAILWLADERIVFAGDLVLVRSQGWMGHGEPEEWLRILDRIEALEPARIVPGHGPVGDVSAIEELRAYITDVLRLAEEEGEPEAPARYAGWQFPDGTRRNVEFLRSR